MKKVNIKLLVVSVLICQLAGIIGSIFTTPSINSWYLNLNKPSFNPPGGIFGPVWITLFFLMGISLYIVLNKGIKKREVKKGIYLFSIQLLFNILWSIFFFGLHNPLLAFIDLVILWVFILLTILQFYKISKNSAYLLIPYILWVSFAGILNLAIYLLNI